jgi:hypothetical protein
MGVAIVVVRHLKKGNDPNPLYRGGGSIGIIGAARIGLLVAPDPEDANRRVLAVNKCNVARKAPSLSFCVHEGQIETNKGLAFVARIEWLGESPHDARSILAEPESEEERTKLDQACEVLAQILASGSVESEDATRQAKKAGIAERTLERGKARLGVRTKREGFGPGGKWFWSLPAAPWSARETAPPPQESWEERI